MIIYSNTIVKVLTFGFARGLTLFPFIFIRKSEKGNVIIVNHEKIHIRQQLELLLVGFWLWYFFEFIKKFIRYKKFFPSYRNIVFEKEAYANEYDLYYLGNRKMFSFLDYRKEKDVS